MVNMDSSAYDNEMAKSFLEPFDEKLVRQLPASGRRPAFDYIDLPPIVNRIIETVGSNWTVEFEKFADTPETVKCTLTIAGVIREGIGQGNGAIEPWKVAETDAFKRAARYHGLALYMWEKDSGPDREERPNTKSGPPADGEWKTRPISDKQAKTIFGIANDFDIDEDEIRANVLARYNKPIEQITAGQASEFIDILKAPAKEASQHEAQEQQQQPRQQAQHPPATQRSENGALLVTDAMKTSIINAAQRVYRWNKSTAITNIEKDTGMKFDQLDRVTATEVLRRLSTKSMPA